jgi:hypothetical protein
MDHLYADAVDQKNLLLKRDTVHGISLIFMTKKKTGKENGQRN